jgi:tetratricopeptide (TPR) repeat protein
LLLDLLVKEPIALLERLAYSFVASLGLFSVPAFLLIRLNSNLHTFKWVVTTITLLLCIVHVIVAARRGDASLRSATSFHFPKWSVVCLWAATLLAICLMLSLFVAVGRIFEPSDRIVHTAVIRHYLETDSIFNRSFLVSSTTTLSARQLSAVWEMFVALVVSLSRIKLDDLYNFYLPLVLIVLSYLAIYSLTWHITGSHKAASLVCLVHTVFCFADILRLPPEIIETNVGIGFYQLLKSPEDKSVLRLAVFPVSQLILLRFYEDGKGWSPVLALGVIALVFIHPLGLVLFGISFAAFSAFRLLVNRSRTSLIKTLVVLLIVVGALSIPLLQRQELAQTEDPGFLESTSSKNPGLWLLSDTGGSYLVNPYLLTYQPLILLSFLLVPLLAFSPRTEIGAQFLLASSIAVLATIYNPIIAPILGRLVTPHMIWRIGWIHFAPLVIVYVGIQGFRFLEHYDSRLAGIVLPVGFVILIIGSLFHENTLLSMQRLAWYRDNGVSAEHRDVLTFLRQNGTPGSVILAPNRLTEDIPSMVGHSYGLFFRFREPLLPSARQDIVDFYKTTTVVDRHLDILSDYGIDYLIVQSNHPLDLQFSAFSPAFKRVYANRAYAVFAISLGWQEEPLIQHLVAANTFFDGKQYKEAKLQYEKAMELEPDNFWALLRLAETYESEDMPEQAAVMYQRSLESMPTAAAHIALGNIHRNLGNPTEALNQYRAAYSLDSDSRELLVLIKQTEGEADQAHGNLDQAVWAFRTAAQLAAAPPPPAPENEVAYVPAGWPSWPSNWFDRLFATEPTDGVQQSHPEIAVTSSSTQGTWSLLEHLDSATVDVGTADSVHKTVFTSGLDPRLVLFQHPTSEISYSISIPADSHLAFSLALSPEVWSLGIGDGVQFDVYVDNGNTRSNPFSEYIDPKNIPEQRKWHDRDIDLSPWAGQTITLTLATDPGPNGDKRYDWAGWGEPCIIQPIAYDFLAGLPNADRGGADEDQVGQDTITIDYEPRPVLFQHPVSQLTYRLEIPQQASLHFGLGLDPAVWSPDKGDGVEYNLYVRYPNEPYVLNQVYHRYLDPKNVADDRHWLDQVVDLSDYGGQIVDLIFEALPGPAGDASFDWGGWSTPVLVADDMAVLNPAPTDTASPQDVQP